MNKSILQNIIFLTVFLCLCYYFNYQHIATLPPQGQHAWRQTDGASQALNYYQFGLNFFKPEVHNVVVHGGASAAELPVLYYISALFMAIFEPEAGVIRWVHLLIFGIGLWFLSRILTKVSDNIVFGVIGSLLFFCLPVVVFYAFNFLPNAPALGLTFISWWYFYRFYSEKKTHLLVIGMIFTALAAMIKPTTLVSFIIMGCLWLFDCLRKEQKRDFFKQPISFLSTFLIVIVPFVAWRLWANAHSNSALFLNRTLPIWDASPAQNAWTWQWLHDFWFRKITFTQPTFLFLSVIVAFMLILLKKIPAWISLTWWLMLFGVISVGALFFQQFSVHDYYAIDFLILPAFTFIILAMLIKHTKSAILRGGVTALLFVLLVLNARFSKADLEDRYNFKDPYLSGENKAMFKTKELRAFIKNLGISPRDTVLSINDPSPNTSLFYLNVKGFTLWNNKVKICVDAQSKLPDVACVEYLIKNKSCKYLIISNLNDGIVKSFEPFMKPEKLLGIFDGSVYVYRL